jgi:hypothetical protein
MNRQKSAKKQLSQKYLFQQQFFCSGVSAATKNLLNIALN